MKWSIRFADNQPIPADLGGHRRHHLAGWGLHDWGDLARKGAPLPLMLAELGSSGNAERLAAGATEGGGRSVEHSCWMDCCAGWSVRGERQAGGFGARGSLSCV